MLHACFREAKTFKKVLDALSEVLKEAIFKCDKNGIGLQAMDESHVVLVSMMLYAPTFEKYQCDSEMKMGINIASLVKMLKCANNDDALVLKAQDDSNVVTLQFVTKKGFVTDFDLNLIDVDYADLAIPETEFGCTVKMPSTDLSVIIRNLASFGTTILLTCMRKTGLIFSVSDVETRRGSTKVTPETSDVILNIEESMELPFAAKFLTMFVKAANFSPRVQICLSTSSPMVLEYEVVIEGSTVGFLKYFLAPKVVDE